MKGILSCMALFLLASWQVSCRSEIADEGDQPIADSVPDGTGGDSDVVIGPPGDMAKITFFVDDRANKTFADGQMRWTGSFKWDVAANTIVYATSWLPTDGPFPLLYDDGPQSAGGHEMEGAEKGDNIFSIEVFYKAEKQDPTFQYGVLNELDFWMWTGPNGSFDIPKGSTATFNLQGLVLEAFGNVDLKLTVDVNGLAPDFADVPEWGTPNVYLKSTATMWAPVQILDAGPEGQKGDDAAGDGFYTFIQGKNLGKHTGLLPDGNHAQFTFVFSQAEETAATGKEYKALTEGSIKGLAEGVKAYVRCAETQEWQPVQIVWEKDSWGSTDNTTVVAKCEGNPPPPPECTPDNDTCGAGKKCIANVCQPWCETKDECAEGQDCVNNQCQDVVVVSSPKISSVNPDAGPTDGGTLVTITGTDFQDGAKVAFDAVPATGIVVKGAASIECVTPQHAAGGVDVTVSNPDSGTDTFIKGFQYVEETLAPVIDSVEPTQGPVTGGTPVHLYGSNFLPNPTVFFGTTEAASVEFVDSTHVVAVSPAGALGKVSVKLVNSDGQSAVLADAFTYVPNTVDYIRLMLPLSLDTLAGDASEATDVEIWEPDVTPGTGAGAGLAVQLGFGPAGTNPQNDPGSWTWKEATYETESGNNDVWTGTLTSDKAGTYRFTFRASMDQANWVYADSTGNLDGFDVAATGTWNVIEAGEGPVILQVNPKWGSVLGGDTVTISGVGLKEVSLVVVDSIEVQPVSAGDKEVVFVTPKHKGGPVSIGVKAGADASVTKENAFTYLLKATPALDGSLSDWDELLQVAENKIVSNWDPAINHLDALYLAFDKDNLYIGIVGACELQNYIVGYLDVDYGLGTGFKKMEELSDNTGNGDLDDSLSNVLLVKDAGFGAEMGFGSKGMSSFMMGSPLGDSKYAGWRQLDPPYDFPWIDGTMVCGKDACEAAIPLATLFAGGVPDTGKTAALFMRLVNAYGGNDGISNQCLPGWQEDNPYVVGLVAAVEVR